MDWRCGSSSRAPALQAQSPQFKPQDYQKKKKIVKMVNFVLSVLGNKREGVMVIKDIDMSNLTTLFVGFCILEALGFELKHCAC
jgi:hypothetical protein